MRRSMILAALVFATSVSAQDANSPAEKPKDQPAPEEQPAEKPKAEEPPTTLGLKADFNAYIKKAFPHLDPAGEHDIFKLKNYSDPEKRHAYTMAMTQLISLYVTRLHLNTTLVKLFDQYSRGKEGAQPTFKALHAVLLLNPMSGMAAGPRGRKLLEEAAAQAPDFACPWYFMAEAELGSLRHGGAGPQEAGRCIDNALRIRPDYLDVKLQKAQWLCLVSPPRNKEAEALLQPLFKAPPASADDFEQLAAIYRAVCRMDTANGYDRFMKTVGEFTSQKDQAPALRARARQMGGIALREKGNYDEAISWFEQAIKDMDLEQDPDLVLRSRIAIADTWGMKAMALQDANPGLPGDARKQYDSYLQAARDGLEQVADLEAKYLPIDLRGVYALRYVNFMASTGDIEHALVWLEDYLKKTDLPGIMRTFLERRLFDFRTNVNPEEASLLKQLREYVGRDAPEELAAALRQALKAGVKFTTTEALDFFVEQLKSRNREVVSYCAVLASNVAAEIGGEAPRKAAEALADRLDQEKECASEEQQVLQTALCAAIKTSGLHGPMARAIRQVKVIVEAGKDAMDLNTRRVFNVFSDKAFLDSLKLAGRVPPAQLGGLAARDRKQAATWLEDLAVSLEKPITKEPEKKPGEPEKTPTEPEKKPEQPEKKPE